MEGDRYYADYAHSTRRRVVTRVSYQEPRVVVRRRKTVLSSGYDGSFATVGGAARRGSVRVVNSGPAYGRDRVVLVNRGQSAGGASTVYVPVAAAGVGVSQVQAVGAVGAVGVPPAVIHPSISGGTAYQPVGVPYTSGVQPRIPPRKYININ